MSSTDRQILPVSALDTRLTNLRVGASFALGVETEGGIIDVTQAGATLGLPAPRDMDDLLQNQRAPDVRAVLDAIARDPKTAAIIPTTAVTFAPLVTRPEKSSALASIIASTRRRPIRLFPTLRRSSPSSITR